MYAYINCDVSNSPDIIRMDEINIFMLLFADDTVLFSKSSDGLQRIIDKLYEFCTSWGIEVNVEKTAIMVFKKGNRKEICNLKYNNESLKNVDEYSYLGVRLKSNCSFSVAQKRLSDSAMKALYSLNTLFDHVSLKTEDKIKLFDSMVVPILCYGCEIWGFHKAPDIERVHLKFLKQVLSVKQKTATPAVYGELGRFPLLVERKIRLLKYWQKILKNPKSLVYRLCFMKDLDGNFILKWTQNVKMLLDSIGFSYVFSESEIGNNLFAVLKQRIYDQYIQDWFYTIDNSSKLDTYCCFKNIFEIETYILKIENPLHCSALAKLRCSSHNLAIEDGRYRNIERRQRKCTFCNINVIEDEYHFVLVCPLYRELRKALLPHFYYTWPTITKFKLLMKTTKPRTIKKLAKFVYLAFKKRQQVTAE